MTETVFDEVMRLLTPDRVLKDPRATGEGVALCLIDSGVDAEVVTARAAERGDDIRPIRGAVFRPGVPPREYDGRQSSGHGTTVADVILTLAPRVQLYTADVFGPEGHCGVETLIEAFDHAVNHWGCKIVNLSLGVREDRLRQLPKRHGFLRAIEDGYFKDVLIFAAAHNEHPFIRSYPAVFTPPLISVDKNVFDDDPLRFAYELRERVEFQAHGRAYFGPNSREPATSWATPHLAGIAARILSLRPNLKPFEIKTLLYWLFQASRAAE